MIGSYRRTTRKWGAWFGDPRIRSRLPARMRMMMPDDEKFRRFLAASAAGYAVAALNFVVRRRGFEADMKRLDGKRTPPDIWPALGTAYMSTIAAVAWAASRDRLRAAELAKPLLVAKGVSAALFAHQFLRTRRRSFLLSAIVDTGILGATIWLGARAKGKSPLHAVNNIRRLRTEKAG